MMSADVKEEAPEEQSPDIDQLELLHIKEESERIWASQDGEQLNVKEETDDTRFPLTVVHMKSEEDEEKPLFSQLHQQQTEDRDLPSSSSGDKIKAEIKEEDCGTEGSSRNPDRNTHGGSSNYSETEDSEDDEEDDDVKHHESELKRLSDSETEDITIGFRNLQSFSPTIIDEDQIETVSCFKYLSMVLDCHLKLDSWADVISTKAQQRISF
ncbi:hypothetical protein CRENBAI_011416 [Crenichthys baileyi]|uniref:Uncharacterized protein n=1 Tax=Crenichthys baileyi TaxID=28760 RepID=A0AAV9SKG3_9TELE